MLVVELMIKAGHREALIEKVVDCTVVRASQFGGENIMDFLATYRNEMPQRDSPD